jgi:hypothetical protein
MGEGGKMSKHRDECAGCVALAGAVIACLLTWGLAVKGITALVGWMTK